MPAVFFAVLALYALHVITVNIIGVHVGNSFVSAPLPITPKFPALCVGRTRIPVSGLLSITALGSFLGYESVGLTTLDGQIVILFANRTDRLAFFDAVAASNQHIKFYRNYPAA